jgi:hypothetical protein
MTYKITNYSREKAQKLGVIIKPSTRKNKKLDIFNKEGELMASIGDINYTDFASTGDKEQRRRFKLRFDKSRKNVGSNTWWSDQLLW